MIISLIFFAVVFMVGERSKGRWITQALLVLLLAVSVQAETNSEYVASEPGAIQAMLDAAQVQSKDALYDLGSGDGRIVIAAAKRGAKAVGVEIDPLWVAKSRAAINHAHLQSRARIVWADFFLVSLADASIITLFLPQTLTNKLEPVLRSLKSGTRIISNGVRIGNWQPQQAIDINQILCNAKNVCWKAPIFLWVA